MLCVRQQKVNRQCNYVYYLLLDRCDTFRVLEEAPRVTKDSISSFLKASKVYGEENEKD